jgi:hypothetical protein
MFVQSAEIIESQVSLLVGQINQQGYACIENFVSDVELAQMRAFVRDAIAQQNGEYVGFTGPEQVAGSGLDEFARSRYFRSLMERLFEQGSGRAAPEQPFYQVLRCLSGKGARKHSYIFHYDSYVVTALIPIEIPTSGLSGDLLMLPNTRKIRSRYLFNVMDKLLLDNKLTQLLLRGLVACGYRGIKKIKMTPGNIYFFWGYRSIHTNEPCDPDVIRATALFHYANPHRPR